MLHTDFDTLLKKYQAGDCSLEEQLFMDYCILLEEFDLPADHPEKEKQLVIST